MNASNGTLDADRIAADLRRLVTDAEQFLSHASEGASADGEALRERFTRKLATLRAQLGAAEEKALAKARETAQRADKVVRAHPYESIGVAAALGLLIGFLVAKR